MPASQLRDNRLESTFRQQPATTDASPACGHVIAFSVADTGGRGQVQVKVAGRTQEHAKIRLTVRI